MTSLFIWCSCEAQHILDVKESDVLHVWMHVPWYLPKFRGVGLWGLGRVFLIIFFVGSQIPRWFRWFPNLDHTRGPWNHGNKIHHTSTWHQRMVEGEPWGGCDIGTPTPIPFGTPTQPEGPGMQVCRRPGAIVQFIYLYEMRRQAPACLYKFTILH